MEEWRWPHFTRRELECRHCGRFILSVALLDRLERLRGIVGRPLRIVSGTRCAAHNRAVGGARQSYHLSGRAADVPAGYCTRAQAMQAGFTGIGLRRGLVVHLDVRPGAVVTFHE